MAELTSRNAYVCSRLLASLTLCTLLVPMETSALRGLPLPMHGQAASSSTQQTNTPVTSVAPSPIPEDATVKLNNQRYDLRKRDDLDAFTKAVKGLLALSKEEKKEDKKEAKKEEKREKKAEKKAETEGTGNTEGEENKEDAPVEKRAASRGGRDWSAKPVRRGLKALEQLAEAMQKGTLDSAAGIPQTQEISWAVESNFVTPYFWRPNLELSAFLFNARALTLNASGRGRKSDPAADLVTYEATDLSKVDPKPSDYWSPPSSVGSQDLYTGFDRAALPDFSDSICTYSSPHEGSGVHPSFEVVWHDERYKVKFGEERSSGPFASRIFVALGYPTEIYDYTSEVKVRWDRRILSQFNSRELNSMHVRLIGIPITNVHVNPYFDPFDYIQYAVLKDGSRVEAKALRERLFPVRAGRSRPRHPELNPSLYSKAFEETLDYLVMKDASYTQKGQDDSKEIGAWDYNYLDHPKRRELRGMAVLDAWMDNWDVRWGNNRLGLVEEKDGSYRLEHTVKDLGALFGNSSGLLRLVHGKWKINQYQNAPNDYEWSFTHSQPSGKMTAPIRDYMPNAKNQAFYEMNLDDARWMARLIAQISENQIKQALIGAGYDAVRGRYLLEKLVSRRDQMIKDFGLSGEIKLLRPEGVNKRLSYDPGTDGAFDAVLPSGAKCSARDSGEYVVVNGVLKAKKTSNRQARSLTRTQPD